ncbi:MAG: S8 family serine peptidase [Gammaproteobacteria bacterium]|nr:S8 family serine peptidase [Gammaproteobacteria bacterium]
MAAVCLALGAALSTAWAGEPPAAAGDRILINIEDPRAGRMNMAGSTGAYRRRFSYNQSSYVRRVLDEVQREHHLTEVEGWMMTTLGYYCAMFETAPGTDAEQIIAAIQQDPRVALVQRVNEFQTQIQQRQGADGTDPYRNLQYAYDSLEFDNAHNMATGRGVNVAVVDTGVVSHHPDLVGQSIREEAFLTGRENDAGTRGHGTAIAGILAATPANGIGIAGMAPEARIMSLKACWEPGGSNGPGVCNSYTLARALDYAINHGADVINLSLTGPADDVLTAVLQVAFRNNIIVVGTAGNGPRDAFPGSIPGVIAVRSAREGNAQGTADGTVIAHGEDILTLIPPDGYDFLNGDSLATAQIASIAALARQLDHGVTAADLKLLLIASGDDQHGGYARACHVLHALAGGGMCATSLSFTETAGK